MWPWNRCVRRLICSLCLRSFCLRFWGKRYSRRTKNTIFFNTHYSINSSWACWSIRFLLSIHNPFSSKILTHLSCVNLILPILCYILRWLFLALSFCRSLHVLEFFLKSTYSRASVIIKLGIENNLMSRVWGTTATSLLIWLNSNIICHVSVDVAISIRNKSRRSSPSFIMIIAVCW